VRRWFLLLACIGAAACGLSIVGQLGDESGPERAQPNGEGGSGVTSDGGLGGPAECDSGLAPGAVVLPPDGGACPTGTIEQIVQTSPHAVPGACSCGACAVTKEASCAGANFVWTWGGNSACVPGASTYDVTADNACIMIFAGSTTIAAYNEWDRTPQGGVCSAPKVVDAGSVTSTPVRQCVADPNACAVLSEADRVCVPGDPDGGACSGVFSVPMVVGDSAAVDCTACTCTRSGLCHLEYHDDPACADTAVYEREADGTCTSTGKPKIQSIKVYPKGLVCNTTPGTATASLTNTRTLCCKP
jgi:hypothetical protein